MTRVVVNRQTWLRGEGTDQSYLRRFTDDKMCCLGFVCKSLGQTRTDIEDVRAPGDILHQTFRVQELMRTEAKQVILTRMMSINDVRAGITHVTTGIVMSEPKREQLLTELAKEVDIELVFEG